MPMTPQDDAPPIMTRTRIVWALLERTMLLHEATSSLYAERYQSAAAPVVGCLDSVVTRRELMRVCFSPHPILGSRRSPGAQMGRSCCFHMYCWAHPMRSGSVSSLDTSPHPSLGRRVRTPLPR
jgi:hypothetical protein